MDEAILKALNVVVGHPGQIDTALILIASNPLFKGVPVMMLVWALWTRPAPHRAQLRARLAAALVAGVLAIALGRALSMLLPYRPRPIHDPDLALRVADTLGAHTLNGWSSMPSDHAVLFFALAAGIAMAHRLAGLVAGLHALVVVSLPRIALGFHWPSDILVGAFAGGLLAVALVPMLARLAGALDLERRLETQGWVLYPILFLVTHQLGTMFAEARWLATVVAAMAGVTI
ncbi:phosphatase PAP2 family protein [Limimaricola pyoseonensis]|uniref:Undecaprenyl-diphosphatase n=1 Tax=Limimaricola pyoseonensis TaxID=521013 RepID=A0A1G7IDW6_9RHOB|nr:phosphatase PAP2 family protein [Limimaricola pyoseonensis]SDF10815.1 undecaprenyl-diphosphatase [Limimaricola pyoseonensis]